MIPHARPVMGVAELAERLGLAAWHVRSRLRQPGAPKPVNLPPTSPVQDRHTARTELYDQTQIDAWLDGVPIPALPTVPSPTDLLDRGEAALVQGYSATRSFDVAVRDGRQPAPAQQRCGLNHWLRSALQGCRSDYVERRGSPVKPDRYAAVRQVLEDARSAGEELSIRQTMHRSGVGRRVVQAVKAAEEHPPQSRNQ